MDGGEGMKRVCLTVLCILLVGCGNAETAETEEKIRFENLDPAKVNMQYGGLKEWDRFYNSFYEQKEGSDLIVLGTVEDYSCFAGGIEMATDISLRVDDVLKGDMEAGEHIMVRKLGGAVTVEEYLQSMEDAGITYWNAEELKTEYSEEERRENYIQISFCDLDPVIGQKSLYFLEKDAEKELYYRLCDGFGQYVETASGEYVNAYEIADEKRNADEPMMLALGETVEFDPDAAPEERINIYTMDEIKEGMETYTAPPTDYPGAEEDALEMDCEPG